MKPVIRKPEEELVSPDSEYHIVYVRNPFTCFLHWLLVFAIIGLSLSGLYIGSPELFFGQGAEAYNNFIMAKMRFIHFAFASILVLSLLLRLYFSFKPACRKDIHDIIPTWNNLKMAVELAVYYVTLKGGHAHFRFINPIGGIAIFLMIILFIGEIVTGFTLYFQGANSFTWGWALVVTDRIEILLGGTPNVRLIHHLITWVLLAMVIIHIYMQIWKDLYFPEAGIASIIAGYKIFHKDIIKKHIDRYKARLLN
ncbi:MAG: Ni/Fe-hydrogenase, b-type cytochrome subunit [Nitrospinae bacterium]|nr:Ni/Fe-hydrogenase, b-type cytochrome subunit [Nitrospinota bacterium]